MNKPIIWTIVLLVVILIGGGLFISGLGGSKTADSKVQSVSGSGTPNKEFIVTGRNFKFYLDGVESPTLSVNQGDRVKITFINDEGFHDFVLDDFNVRTPQIGAGKSASVEFTATKKGTFEYYCSVGTHRQMGMKGSFVVN